MRPRAIFHLAIALLVCAIGAPLVVSGRAVYAQNDQATVRAVPPSGGVSSSAGTVDVAINVEHVSNLAGFQFVLSVDPGVLRPVTAKKTLFLAGTGREIVCGDPTIEEAAVRVACVTLRETPPGVDGSGTVANVTFKLVGKGTSRLALTRVKLVHPDGTELPSTSVDGKMTISGGGSWWTTTRIILVSIAGALILLAALAAIWRMRAAAAANPKPVGDPEAGA